MQYRSLDEPWQEEIIVIDEDAPWTWLIKFTNLTTNNITNIKIQVDVFFTWLRIIKVLYAIDPIRFNCGRFDYLESHAWFLGGELGRVDKNKPFLVSYQLNDLYKCVWLGEEQEINHYDIVRLGYLDD